MELGADIWIALIPVALMVLLMWGAWKLARPTQLRQELNAQLKAVLDVHNAIVMRDQELGTALRTERAYVQQLQRQLELCQRS
ncbi:hypothetical protein [Pseudomonas aeruginosa]|uniref:hypothetical protein n=1 Tax=Pseudomonas aeruginosa group TaxID=136841 RepID=UPI0004452D9A|nr:hypothetical protein [Pseudomonas aeruginosa]EJN6721463.1 hypothetical protein [Pseudomonas aeruginosa]ELP1385635.1 hypothetical protein [Pseudomonas aeruginosa]ETV22928.1 hypothetical protein Q048_04892 [Pseudomonas aeruginosa BWHPSA043]KHE33499.1 hypothetical protein LH31_18605 [Pseudomonas aeruginosa]MBW6173769.1 hypothetical protein [Pseudomonas aeruginosa]